MGMVIYLRRASPADIARLTSDAADWEDFAFEQGDPVADLIDFDKAWHALHYMLTVAEYDTVNPLGIIAGNGEMFGTDENGYGGFSIISPDAMAAFNTALSALSDEALAKRYDPAAMAKADIYLSDVFLDEGNEALEYVVQGLPRLRIFAASCAAAGDGALRILS